MDLKSIALRGSPGLEFTQSRYQKSDHTALETCHPLAVRKWFQRCLTVLLSHCRESKIPIYKKCEAPLPTPNHPAINDPSPTSVKSVQALKPEGAASLRALAKTTRLKAALA